MTQSQNMAMQTDPAIIHHLIFSQAGTLGKALQELAQNSIDAGATAFHLTLTATGFMADDDGRGFDSIDEIRANFATFGRPHSEIEDTARGTRFGRFRLGRAQIWAFAATLWRTGTFLMDVNVKVRGTNIEVQERLDTHRGCRIEGSFYEPLRPSDLYGAEQEVEQLMAWAEIPIYLNGRQINKLPSTSTWDEETEDAYIRYTQAGGLKVYNLGFFVRVYPGHSFGSGIVVTKRHLELNMARNDILDKCPIWRAIRKRLKAHVVAQVGRTSRITEDDRTHLAILWRTGETTYRVLQRQSARLITDVLGRQHTIQRLARAKHLSCTVQGSAVGESLHRRGRAFVLATITLERFGVESLAELRDLLVASLKRDQAGWEASKLQDAELLDFARLEGEVEQGHLLLADRELAEWERWVLRALNREQHALCRWLESTELFQHSPHARTIRAGVSQTASGWTDGRAVIVVNRPLLKLAKQGYVGFVQLLLLLLHEYQHDEDDLGSHGHDPQFYNQFHDIALHGLDNDGYSLFAFARRALDEYLRLVKEAGQRPTVTLQREEDRLVAPAAPAEPPDSSNRP